MVLLAWWWWSPMMTEVSSNFWNWFLVNNLRLKFNQDFSVEVWTRFWSWVFAKILGCSSIQILNFGQDLEAEDLDAEVWLRFLGWSLVKILKLNFDHLKSSYNGESTQPLSPLGLNSFPCCVFVFVFFVMEQMKIQVQISWALSGAIN